MLMGIHPAIGPHLLAVLSEMGHGDELVLADAFFPAHSCNGRVLRADGVEIKTLLEGILPLFPLDRYVPFPLIMMAAVSGDTLDPSVEEAYLHPIRRYAPLGGLVRDVCIERIDRFAFYERAKQAYAVVQSGTTAVYGNILIKKGVVPITPQQEEEE